MVCRIISLGINSLEWEKVVLFQKYRRYLLLHVNGRVTTLLPCFFTLFSTFLFLSSTTKPPLSAISVNYYSRSKVNFPKLSLRTHVWLAWDHSNNILSYFSLSLQMVKSSIILILTAAVVFFSHDWFLRFRFGWIFMIIINQLKCLSIYIFSEIIAGFSLPEDVLLWIFSAVCIVKYLLLR